MQKPIFIGPAFRSDVKNAPVPAQLRATSLHNRRRKSQWLWRIHLATIFVCVLTFVPPSFAQSPAKCTPWNSPPSRDSIAAFVLEAGHRFGLPVSWIEAIIHVESFGQTDAVSPKGAMGVMQIMPATWESLRGQYDLGNNPCDPHDNIDAGVAYLRQMYDRFGSTGFLAAFNAGPGRYEDFLTTGRPLPSETRVYLAKLGALIVDGPFGGSLLANNDAPARMRSPMFVGLATNILNHRAADIQTAKGEQVNPVPTDSLIAQTFALAPHSTGLFVRSADARELP